MNFSILSEHNLSTLVKVNHLWILRESCLVGLKLLATKFHYDSINTYGVVAFFVMILTYEFFEHNLDTLVKVNVSIIKFIKIR